MTYLSKRIHSHFSPSTCYAEMGAKVEVVTVHGEVCIVEHGGNRFPVLIDLLSDVPVEVVVTIEPMMPKEKSKRVKPEIDNLKFF